MAAQIIPETAMIIALGASPTFAESSVVANRVAKKILFFIGNMALLKEAFDSERIQRVAIM
jgi:hypothetical protein